MTRILPALLIGCGVCLSVAAQTPTATPAPSQNANNTANQSDPLPPSTPPLDVFMGSAKVEKLVPGTVRLGLREAMDLGLKHNLGLLLSQQQTETARAQHWRSLSALLPKAEVRAAESVQQVNLAAFGIPFTVNGSTIVGPFSVFDARPSVTDRLLDFNALNRLRAADEGEKAVRHNIDDARELVILVVGNEYLLTLANAALLESAQAQATTAKAIYDRSLDLKKAGVAAGIDVLRSQVQLQQQQQRVLAAQNQLAQQRMQFARVIGLPVSQAFELTDQVPNPPTPPVDLEEALVRAYERRPDYLALASRVKAAELLVKAAQGESLPTFDLNGDIGVIGRSVGSARETYTVAGSLRIPVFQGGRVKADVLQARSNLQQLRFQMEDTKNRIEMEVRSAALDVNSSNDQVKVARESIGLAAEQLKQSQDRYAAGLSGSLEVVQSQEAVVTANETLIQALYRNNVARLTLARALGVAEQQARAFLGGR